MDRNIQIILVNATYSKRRTHEWWMKLMNGYNTKFRTFAEAVNLVVSVQSSRAASERVLSQLSFVRRIAGDATLQDLLELRCFMQCNLVQQ
eukprot:scaffold797_cov408-Chaetoceros_neogracile.AAC.13